jgi:hypothetical protein
MANTEQIRQQVQSPAPFSTWLGVVLLMLLFGAIAVAIIGPAPRGDTYEQQRAQNREKKLKDLREEDAKALTSYAWIDKNKGTVRLPIERAMELTAVELAKKKPMAAGPIATPTPEASPAPNSPAPAPASPAPAAAAQASGPAKTTSVVGQHSEAQGQPAAAINPPSAQPSTQPGASAAPSASPKSAAPTASPSTTP